MLALSITCCFFILTPHVHLPAVHTSPPPSPPESFPHIFQNPISSTSLAPDGLCGQSLRSALNRGSLNNQSASSRGKKLHIIFVSILPPRVRPKILPSWMHYCLWNAARTQQFPPFCPVVFGVLWVFQPHSLVWLCLSTLSPLGSASPWVYLRPEQRGSQWRGTGVSNSYCRGPSEEQGPCKGQNRGEVGRVNISRYLHLHPTKSCHSYLRPSGHLGLISWGSRTTSPHNLLPFPSPRWSHPPIHVSLIFKPNERVPCEWVHVSFL